MISLVYGMLFVRHPWLERDESGYDNVPMISTLPSINTWRLCPGQPLCRQTASLFIALAITSQAEVLTVFFWWVFSARDHVSADSAHQVVSGHLA